MDSRPDVSSPSEVGPLPLVVTSDASDTAVPLDGDATIGRDASCTVTVNSSLVSRLHARAERRDDGWILEDAGSTNGLYVDGERREQVAIDAPRTVALGPNGPRLTFRPARPSAPSTDPPSTDPSSTDPSSTDSPAPKAVSGRDASAPSPPAPPPSPAPADGPSPNRSSPDRSSPAGARASSPGPERSVTAYFDHYFGSDEIAGGEHTRLLRRAYRRARHTERRHFLIGVTGVLSVALLLAVVALWQYQERAHLEGMAERVFLDVKRQDLALAQLRLSIEEDEPIAEQLAERERERRMLNQRYTGYVRELGLHRRLSAEEQLIHSVARIFGESEFSMPAGFVREVRRTLHEYWLGPGRSRFEQAIRRAQENGYVEPIVHRMMRRGLPPEFFYLALQESDFDVDAVGPPTRWGIAKGMWQFIPSTARRFGLAPGPRAADAVVDPLDERHDFERSTDAASRYLQTIYTTDAQASGLLVIASYNWGEHRINRKLSRLPDPSAAPAGPAGHSGDVFAGIPEDPSERTYWRFLTEYRDRMPEETRTYVLRVFAAAVIGQDPKRYGFPFDNPLQPAIRSFDASLGLTGSPE